MKEEKEKLMKDILALIGDFADKHQQIAYYIRLDVSHHGDLLGYQLRWKYKNEKGKWK